MAERLLGLAPNSKSGGSDRKSVEQALRENLLDTLCRKINYGRELRANYQTHDIHKNISQ